MKVKYEYNSTHMDISRNRTIKGEVEMKDFYEEIAKLLVQEDGFNQGGISIKVDVDGYGTVQYDISKRDMGSTIHEKSNDLPDSFMEMDKIQKYCTCVAADDTEYCKKNAYKYYKLEVIDGIEADMCWRKVSVSRKALLSSSTKGGTYIFRATYGRIGQGENEQYGKTTWIYPVSMFWVKWYEKIMSHGYQETNEIIASDDSKYKPSCHVSKQNEVTASSILFEKLTAFSKLAVKKAKLNVPVNHAIITSSKKYVDEMKKATTLEEFNDILLRLVVVLQRPVPTGDGNGIKNLLASSFTREEIDRVVQREESLIKAMEGSLYGYYGEYANDFSQYDIEVYDATDQQKREVMRKLSDELKPKVRNIYRVIPKKQKEKFNDYLQKNGIEKVKMFWHGSRNENWMSIIQNSLQLSPNAVITGKMFGHGIYFAPSSMKSWGYTSCKGSYWANGNDDTGYMGLYACAYGVPYEPTSWTPGADWIGATKRNKANCLHAKKDNAGLSLKNDEIVFYSESAMLLNYIVEFAQ